MVGKGTVGSSGRSLGHASEGETDSSPQCSCAVWEQAVDSQCGLPVLDTQELTAFPAAVTDDFSYAPGCAEASKRSGQRAECYRQWLLPASVLKQLDSSLPNLGKQVYLLLEPGSSLL